MSERTPQKPALTINPSAKGHGKRSEREAAINARVADIAARDARATELIEQGAAESVPCRWCPGGECTRPAHQDRLRDLCASG